MRRLRIFLADDHALLRDGLRALIERQPSMEVVGEAGDGREAVARIDELRPDVVVMDIAMPGLNGLEATRQIRKLLPRTKILVLSQYDDREYVYELVQAGASGYILKGSPAGNFLAAIAAVARGESFLHPGMASVVAEARAADAHALENPLTAREREVLQLLAEGHSHIDIGRRLAISPKTVETHRANIAAKLDIRDRAGLVKYAIKKGFVKL